MKVQNSIRIGSNHAIKNAAMLSKQFVFGIPEAIEVNKRTNKIKPSGCIP